MCMYARVCDAWIFDLVWILNTDFYANIFHSQPHNYEPFPPITTRTQLIPRLIPPPPNWREALRASLARGPYTPPGYNSWHLTVDGVDVDVIESNKSSK